jgi:hypothetical protein
VLTTEEQRQEAGRLLSLDDKGLELEEVAMALRIADQSERAMRELEELDREFIQMLDGRYSTEDHPPEGPLEGPNGQPLGT